MNHALILLIACSFFSIVLESVNAQSAEHVFSDAHVTSMLVVQDSFLVAGTTEGTLLASSDAGDSWRAVNVNPSGFQEIRDLEIVIGSLIYVRDATGSFYLDGTTGTRYPITPDPLGIDSAVGSDGMLITIGGDGVLRQDSDGQFVKVLDLAPCYDPARLHTSAAHSQNHFVTQSCGSEGSDGFLFRSVDDGHSWELLYPNLSFNDVHELSSGRLLLASNVFLGYMDDSATIVSGFSTLRFTSLAAGDGGAFYASLDLGGLVRVFRSGDQGATWEWTGIEVSQSDPQLLAYRSKVFVFGRNGIFRIDSSLNTLVQDSELPTTSCRTPQKMYPNPADHKLVVEFTDCREQPALSVYNVLGRKVMEVGWFGPKRRIIDTSILASGPYFLVTCSEEGCFSTGFVVSRSSDI